MLIKLIKKFKIHLEVLRLLKLQQILKTIIQIQLF